MYFPEGLENTPFNSNSFYITYFASWSCKIFASLVPPSLPDSPNQPQNNKTKIFIWVFIILGIYNFDGVSHSLLNTSSYICRHLPVSAIVYTNVHYQNDNKKHWPNFLLWIANIIFFSSGLFVKYSAMNYYVKIFFTQFWIWWQFSALSIWTKVIIEKCIWWEIFMEQELRFGLDLGRFGNYWGRFFHLFMSKKKHLKTLKTVKTFLRYMVVS